MKTNAFLYILSLVLLIAACDEDDFFDNDKRITGHGEILTDTVYTTNAFEAVNLEGVANVYIENGKETSVTITAYENILPYIDAYVVGDELLIRFNEDKNINTDAEIRVDITTEEVNDITLSGVGNFYIKGPTQQMLEVDLSGVGNVEAFNLPVYKAIVDITGTGNVEVKAKERLEVDIDGLGNVYYMGDPELELDINGLGDIVHED